MDALGVVSDAVGDGVTGLASVNDQLLGGLLTNMTLLNMLFSSLNKTNRAYPKTEDTFESEYDYVIVGGGTAGSVLASRLSEVPCVTVLLLEAGGYANPLSEIPASARALYGSDIDWLYKTEPQKYCCYGQIENRVDWNSGKGLGGGSILNAMLYVRGNKKNYDDWEAQGATGWSYKDVFPYFLKQEDNRNIEEEDEGYHRTGGLMTAEKPIYDPELKDKLLKASANMGYELTDINGERQTGIYDLQGTLRNGQRCSTAKAYLVPAEDRPNLTILKRAFGRKILMEGTTAVGVEFDFKGKIQTVRARKEVIISVGTTRTPQIMMLSGIGPKQELDKFNIPVLVNLPGVGKNLQDHWAAQLNFILSPLIQNVLVKIGNPVNILEYLTKRSGPLASPNQVTLMAFLNGINTTANTPDFPRQELYFAEYATIDALVNANLKPEFFAQVYTPYTALPGWTCLVSLLQPESRGTITLNSLDPHVQPTIQPNYYEKERDLDDVTEGLEICHALGTSEPMKQIGSKPYDTLYPGCEHLAGKRREYYRCYAKQAVTSFWHVAGTARMGQPDDPRSVVDPQLKVIGTTRLRVVSTAVMPTITSGNTNVPTIMIAEKAADMIKAGIDCKNSRRQTSEKCKRCQSRRKSSRRTNQ